MKANYRELSASETLEVSGGTSSSDLIYFGFHFGIDLSGLSTAVTSVSNTVGATVDTVAKGVDSIVYQYPDGSTSTTPP